MERPAYQPTTNTLFVASVDWCALHARRPRTSVTQRRAPLRRRVTPDSRAKRAAGCRRSTLPTAPCGGPQLGTRGRRPDRDQRRPCSSTGDLDNEFLPSTARPAHAVQLQHRRQPGCGVISYEAESAIRRRDVGVVFGILRRLGTSAVVRLRAGAGRRPAALGNKTSSTRSADRTATPGIQSCRNERRSRRSGDGLPWRPGSLGGAGRSMSAVGPAWRMLRRAAGLVLLLAVGRLWHRSRGRESESHANRRPIRRSARCGAGSRRRRDRFRALPAKAQF